MKAIEYKVLCFVRNEELSEEMTQFARNGWSVVGPVTVAADDEDLFFVATMALYGGSDEGRKKEKK